MPETAEPPIDVAAAADVLGVTPSRVLAMVAEGLLHPVGDDDEPRFRAVEVHALHDLGG
jgi:hypothetical protein